MTSSSFLIYRLNSNPRYSTPLRPAKNSIGDGISTGWMQLGARLRRLLMMLTKSRDGRRYLPRRPHIHRLHQRCLLKDRRSVMISR